MRLFLIGYMASGKSTVGKLLAEQLHLPFIDLDDVIASNTGMSFPTIFSTHGEDFFRAQETAALRESIALHDNIVIATGGGTPCFENNMDEMLSNGTVIYLQCDAQTISKRINSDTTARPLASASDFDVNAHLHSRLRFYEQAHVAVDASQEMHRVVEAIVARI
jgi:shikimate kinase